MIKKKINCLFRFFLDKHQKKHYIKEKMEKEEKRKMKYKKVKEVIAAMLESSNIISKIIFSFAIFVFVRTVLG